jgi:adenosine deaminase CECR1
MTLADSPKKRKRTLSQRPHKKMSSQREKPKMDGTVMSDEAPRIIGEVFDELLGDTGAVNKYTEEHEELYGRETKHAWDSKARSGSTTIERKAEIIIRAIREYERNVMFGNKPSEAIPGPETRDMGGQFLTNKDRINNESKLYEIAKMVPKGALLHLHFNAELYPERLLLKARKMDNMYIRSIRPLLDQNDLDLTEMVFNVLDPTMVASDIDIFSPEYPGDATNWKQGPLMWKVWMPWNRFRDEFEKKDFSKRYIQQGNKPAVHNCGETGHIDLEPAENWLKSKMVLSPEEAYGPEQTVNG